MNHRESSQGPMGTSFDALDTLGVSIVICCHNSAKLLPRTLEHLRAQEVDSTIPWEVIVVDNASTDNTA